MSASPHRALLTHSLLKVREHVARTPKEQIKHFLATGQSDALPQGWPGENWLVKRQNADRAMRKSLVEEVHERSHGLPLPNAPVLDYHAFTRSKVTPMVNGLFPEHERASVLAMLEKSVVFLTADNIREVLERSPLRTSRTLANLYLSSIGGKVLSRKARAIVGLSEDTTCYVSHEYFHQQNRFADFVVHEAAHVFHNCKRFTVGLPETRTKNSYSTSKIARGKHSPTLVKCTVASWNLPAISEIE